MKLKLAYIQIEEQFHNQGWIIENIEGFEISESEREKIVELIIQKLDSKETSIRYVASSMIAQFGIQEAKDKLIQRILDEDTFNNNGTMSYALWHLNCKDRLVEVFSILATQSYESKCHAYNILCEQEFEFTRDDLEKMKQILKLVALNKTKNQIFDSETFEMIKDGYEGFKEYLNEQ